MKKMMNLIVLSSVLMAGQAIGYDITIHASQSCGSVNANDAGFFPWSPARYCNCKPGFAPNYTTNGCILSDTMAQTDCVSTIGSGGFKYVPKATTETKCKECSKYHDNGTLWDGNYANGVCVGG